MGAHIARLGLDASHITGSTRGRHLVRKRAFTDAELIAAVREEITTAGVLRRLGAEAAHRVGPEARALRDVRALDMAR